MTDINIGDVVKIVGNKSKHGLEMGTELVVARFVCEGYKAILKGSVITSLTFENPDLFYVEEGDVVKI